MESFCGCMGTSLVLTESSKSLRPGRSLPVRISESSYHLLQMKRKGKSKLARQSQLLLHQTVRLKMAITMLQKLRQKDKS